jgi:Glycosyl hydrolase family 26
MAMTHRAMVWGVCALIAGAMLSIAQGATAESAIQAKRSAILAYLHKLQNDRQTLTGVQVNEYEAYIDCTSADRMFAMTGTRPAIMGLELMNVIAYPPYESYITDRALTQMAAGGLVTMSWHERNPVEVCTRGEAYECAKKAMSADTLRAVLTKGTPENKLWLADVDKVGAVLGRLRDRGIVVLFRPYHEMNGGWFWWGKKEAYPQLWDALYEELAVRRKLDNLIWVWSADRDVPDAPQYFPRRHKPDIVGIDVYESDPDSPKYAAGRANVTALGGSAPFVVAEVGLFPSEKIVDSINPAWVLSWGEEYLNSDWSPDGTCTQCNTPEQALAFLKLKRMVPLEKIPPEVRAAISAGVTNDHPLHKANPFCPSKLR